MGEPLVLTALYRKYAEVLGELKRSEVRSDSLSADLAHLAATIRLFKADFSPDAIHPKLPKTPSRWLPRGQTIQTAIEVLKDASRPLTARQIAEQIIERRGITDKDPKTLKAIANTIRTTLAARRGNGIIAHDTHPKVWEIDRGPITEPKAPLDIKTGTERSNGG